MGAFSRGYGCYNELKEDENFIFCSKFKELSASKGHVDEGGLTHRTTNDQNAVAIINADNKHYKLSISYPRQSSFHGVFSQPGSVRWFAEYRDSMNNIYEFLGTFDSDREAAEAFDGLSHFIPKILNF